ncbi:septum formation inhibitor Maf [Shewanella sp. WXL01]|uniref:Maf family protein n=1 Tax=Shewanella sp. WXL01 TaxID=2709721 RepID=UPI001438440E|nr:nucleoside triphosphate pyrophosphatase [Shewanella sp. WXL01]NKF50511.1 septum formation inhibitor Maf [Shewanella sp. WXL01]
MKAKLTLGSSSVYRQQLLAKLNLEFDCLSPDIDESPLAAESPTALVERLSIEKAKAVAKMCLEKPSNGTSAEKPKHLVIGSDQVAVINGEIIGKPLTHENAVKQLLSASGKAITFYTGLAVLDVNKNTVHSCVEPFTVHFRQLTKTQVKNYVSAEQPLYCAGSFKSEGLGIALFDKLEGDDPNTLIGLPLIKLTDLLSQHDVHVL